MKQSIVPEPFFMTTTELFAPLDVCDDTAEKNLLQLKLFNEKMQPEESVINALANAYATHFYNALAYWNDDNYLEIFEIVSSIRDLFERKQHIGLYYFIVAQSSILEQYVPIELMMLSSYEDLLIIYLKQFTESIDMFLENSSDFQQKNT